MSEHLHILINKKIVADKLRNPNFPDYARIKPKFEDRTSNGLEKCVVAFIELHGGQCERIKNVGRFIDNSNLVTNVIGQTQKIGKGKFIPGTGTNGTSDLSSVIPVLIHGKRVGLAVKWEVKIGADRQSEAQKEYEQAIHDAGGHYYIIKSFDDFYVKYLNLIQQYL